MKTRECSKANAVAMRGLAEGTDLVKGWKVKNYDTEAVKDLLKQNWKWRSYEDKVKEDTLGENKET